MNKIWTYFNPVRIHFGRECRKVLVDEIINQRCLIVSDKRGFNQISNDAILSELTQNSKNVWLTSVQSNPNINGLQSAIDKLKNQSFNAVIGFGGGSAIDSAKVMVVALSEDLKGSSLNEIISQPLLNSIKPLPLYAVPTTSGTGSEVTPFATIWDNNQKKKLSMGGHAVYPKVAIVDPALTNELPKEITLFSGLDAINQAAESVWNRNATHMTIGFATRALKLGFEALPKLFAGLGTQIGRDQMAESSLLAGLAISQTRTSLCHSISYPITAHFGAPHGLACAFTMPAVLRLNLSDDDGRFQQLEKLLDFGNLQHAFDTIYKRLDVLNHIKKYVPSMNHLLSLVPEMYTPERAENSLIFVDKQTLTNIIRHSWNQ